MLCQDQPWCPRSFRICHPSCPPDKEEEEGQVLDSVNLAPASRQSSADNLPWDNIRTLEKHESRATSARGSSFRLTFQILQRSNCTLAGQMFPCSSMVRWRVSSKLRAHTYVGIHFPSHSETLNEQQPYMMEIPNGYARLCSAQSVREALSTFESCSRLDCRPVTDGVRDIIEFLN
jgi:hypothetical protein